jgi:hypothetical protein
MKPLSFQNILPLLLILVMSSIIGYAGYRSEHTLTAATNTDLDGAWEMVWSKTNGVVDRGQTPMQFKIFHDGFFSLIMEDSTGKWNIASAGTYKTDGNAYIETHRYSTQPGWIGSTYWQQYNIQGDTLYFKLFTKVTDSNGKDVTAQYPTIEEKRVRAKQ